MKMEKDLMGFETISEKFSKIKFKERFRNITISSAHDPIGENMIWRKHKHVHDGGTKLKRI